MQDRPALGVVIVSFNTRETTLACLDSLSRCGDLEVVVVDNASTDGTPEAIAARFSAVRLLSNGRNLGFSSACNQGWRSSTALNILFLNSDARLTQEALSMLVAALGDPLVGIVGPRIVDPSGRVEVSTGRDLSPLSEFHQRRLVRGVGAGRKAAIVTAESLHSSDKLVDWVSGACLLARREVLEAVNGFDEGFFLYEEDADLCLRARRAGFRVLFLARASVVHARGTSMAQAPGLSRMAYHQSHLRYYRKHLGPWSRSLLRGLLVARSAAAWVRGQRNEATDLLHLALSSGPT